MSFARLRIAAIYVSFLLVHTSVWAATIPVVDGAVAVASDGDCSLVEAIENANSGSQTHADCAPGSLGEDTVVLAPNGAYLFDITTANVPITGPVMIDGNRATLTHDAGGFFDIEFNGFLKLVHATLRGSVGPDVSAISGSGSLFIADCILEENVNQTGNGGAIDLVWDLVSASAEIRNSIFRNNVSDSFGGAMRILATSSNDSSLLIEGVLFQDNGRWILAGGIESSAGGALRIGTVAGTTGTLNATINRSEFRSNFSTSAGGAIYVYGTTVLQIDRTTIDDNTAAGSRGGGIYNSGAVTTVTRSLLSNNASATDGGGLANFLGSATLVNSTLSGNTANQGGGGVYNVTSGVSASPSLIALFNVTITGNEAGTASLGGGIYNEQNGTAVARIDLQNTLVLGNTAPSSNFDCLNDGGTMESFGYNVRSASALAGCGYSSPGDVSALGAASDNVDPNLADNGGDTLTHAIPPGSDALDIIPVGVNGCDADFVDQRNRLRNSGTGTADCDAGALEDGALTEVCPDDLLLDYQTLTGSEPPFEATSSATLGPSLGIDGSAIEVNAPAVAFVSPTSIGGTFQAGNTTSCP